MKQKRPLGTRTLSALGSLLLLVAGCGAGGAAFDGGPQRIPRPERLISFRQYTNLSELITLICDDAAREFQGFYAPAPVLVHPFLFVNDAGGKSKTVLGMTLSDQMAAMNNNNLHNSDMKGRFIQEMHGVLQEMDGQLRVHISGVNGRAQRHSYSVHVEMNEAIYRALHSRFQAP